MDSLSFFLATSSVLALLGIGMQLWFAAGLFMLATSIFMAAGAFTSTYVSEVLGWSLPIAALIALVASAALALRSISTSSSAPGGEMQTPEPSSSRVMNGVMQISSSSQVNPSPPPQIR